MWALLSDPGHADSFDKHGEAYAPLRRLVEHLARQEYAGRVYAFKSLASFNLTTAPMYQQADGHDVISIEYDPGRGLFGVGYREWVAPTRNPRNPRHRAAANRACEVTQVAEVVDRYVLRLLLTRQPEGAEPGATPDPAA